MPRPWEADSEAGLLRRWGISAADAGNTGGTTTCPDIWELDNGDVAIVGRDLTETYLDRLPAGMSIGPDERLVVIPRNMMIAAKADIPDA